MPSLGENSIIILTHWRTEKPDLLCNCTTEARIYPSPYKFQPNSPKFYKYQPMFEEKQV